MDMFGIGIAIGIGIETEWPTSKSIPMTPELSTASTIHKSERNSDRCSKPPSLKIGMSFMFLYFIDEQTFRQLVLAQGVSVHRKSSLNPMCGSGRNRIC